VAQNFDVVVVGTGAAGTSAANACRAKNMSVAIVDDLPFGGTCALRGCDPKKVLVGAAQLADWSRRMHELGIVTQPLKIDWPALMRFKRTFTEPVSAKRERDYADAGIVAFHGSARFVGESSLSVDGKVLNAKRVVIASGALPVPLHIPGEEHVTTSTQFLDLDRLPATIVFLGGGYISFEFAHLAARAGASVRILDRNERPLRGFDADVVACLVSLSDRLGIAVQTETDVVSIEKDARELTVHAKHRGAEASFSAEMVVHGGGRAAALDGLRLDVANVERTKKGVKVNEFLQSVSNPAVYAAGDAADGGGLPLTPVAGTEGEIAGENVANGNHRSVDFEGLVSILYTIPSLAAIGLSEAQASERGIRYRCNGGDSSQWYSSRRVNADSYFKVLTDESSGRVLGAHLFGPDVEELANLFSLMIRAKISTDVAKDALFGYPTAASDLEYLI
jgi:glutathione reductase (NADPH)